MFSRQDKMKTHMKVHVTESGRSNNSSMTITSYPPPSMSQSSGGQVPIKVLLPTSALHSNSSLESKKQDLLSPSIKEEDSASTSESESHELLVSTFFSQTAGPSITLTANPKDPVPISAPNLIQRHQQHLNLARIN